MSPKTKRNLRVWRILGRLVGFVKTENLAVMCSEEGLKLGSSVKALGWKLQVSVPQEPCLNLPEML